jgi:nucleoside-diphosphate-sugar epimerase
MHKYLVCGAGGFIGGHTTQRLLDSGHKVTCVDVKPIELWFQKHDNAKNISLDLKVLDNCETVTQGQDYVINMACNMGGIGFIEWNKAKCMISVLINTHMLMACEKNNIKKYFFSSTACAYNKDLQQKGFIQGLREDDAYPANPEDGYGWEKLFSERMCRHFLEDFNLDTKVARYHNVYGPLGTFDGGREKSPAALCRKVAQAKLLNNPEIEVWGDGEQTRSYLFIEDCVDATLKFFESDYHGPLNIGSEEQVSINQMIEMIESIADYKVIKKYDLSKPVGVRGRSSNNELIKKQLNWSPKINLFEGLSTTYDWIETILKNNVNSNSIFTLR